MRTITLGVLAVIIIAGHAFGSEGNGDPFPLQTPGRTIQVPVFVADTGTQAYPTPSGNGTQASTLGQMVPVRQNEGLVQSYFEAGIARPAG